MNVASASQPSLTGQTSPEEGFLAVARRWWMLLVMAPLVCAALAYVYATFTTPTYEAEAQLLVVPGTVDSSGLSLASDSAPTYVELVTSPAVLRPTVKELALPYGVERLRTKVRAEADRATRLLTIRVRDDDSERATATATELARRLKIYVDGQPRLAGAPSNRPKTLEIVERGTSSRVGPNIGLSTSFGAFAGLLLSTALALLLGAHGGSVASGEELGVLTQAPFLGTVQRLHQGRRAGRGAQAERSAEGFVGSPLLAGRLRSTGQGWPVRSLLLIGADASSSARDLAANLAATYAAGGLRTKLVNLGHDKKSAGRTRVVKREGPGSRHPPNNGSDTFELLEAHNDAGVVVVSRRRRSLGSEWLALEEIDRLVERLLEDADLVVLEASSVAEVPGAAVWAAAVDATVLVARRGRTRRTAVLRTRDAVVGTGGRLSGAVLTETLPSTPARPG
jgi:capsular polysaccharide biosynthesis protein